MSWILTLKNISGPVKRDRKRILNAAYEQNDSKKILFNYSASFRIIYIIYGRSELWVMNAEDPRSSNDGLH